MNHCILPLFSTPLYCTQIDISSKPKWESIDWVSHPTRDHSKNNKILSEPEWGSIFTQITDHVRKFFYEELKASSNIEIFITTSLANRTSPSHTHHRHNHPNSILSGCLYFDFHPKGISFIKNIFPQVLWDKVDHNLYNSDEWLIQPEPGLLLIWPSHLEHKVELVDAADPVRYSLAFNTWIKGHINSTTDLELSL